MPDATPPARRTPLDQESLVAALRTRGCGWTDVRLSARTGSTNDDLRALETAGALEGTIVTTDLQTAGRGRMDRAWQAPARSGILVSVLLRPRVPQARWGWLPLLTGLALAEVVAGLGVEAGLKWPNDVMVAQAKLAGILAERSGDAVIVGAGLNVDLTAAELPVPTATSLALVGAASLDRTLVLASVVDRLARRYAAWSSADGDPGRSGLARDYADACVSLGRRVRVTLPTGVEISGVAERIDDDGRLVVGGHPPTAVAAGDVAHVR